MKTNNPVDHRYSLLLESRKREGTKLYRIDHKTGQTWLLVANVWIPVVENKKSKPELEE